MRTNQQKKAKTLFESDYYLKRIWLQGYDQDVRRLCTEIDELKEELVLRSHRMKYSEVREMETSIANKLLILHQITSKIKE